MASTTSTNNNENINNERFRDYIETYGLELFEKIQKSKVLVVGAGGIGCELLKNLVLTGFVNIEIIDLDTIDLSNLNRQFLFRKAHIGMSKAKIARESVLKYNSNVNITAHHGDIKTSDFGPQFFKKFDLVMNALDNVSARRHVNRICLSVDVPLIESGTAGYLGQVFLIKKGVTECFECKPTPAPKEYAVCTIRSNPSAPIHCIVWAKMLFGRLFGLPDDSNAVTDMNDNLIPPPDPTQPNPGTPELHSLLQKEKEKGYKQWVFFKIFHVDIDKLSKMPNLWKEKQPPKPLSLDDILNSTDKNVKDNGNNGSIQLKDQRVWSFKENVQIFLDCLDKLKEKNEKEGVLSWDKDDNLGMDFVTAASNIRSNIFGIQLKSKFDCKSMAGNIIPAIATTNAIIGGLIVSDAIKVLDGNIKDCRATYLYKVASNKRLLLPACLEAPNPDCYVCSKQTITLKVNTKKTTVLELVDDILKIHLSVSQPILTVGNNILYEGGSDLDKEELEQRAKAEKKIMDQFQMSDQTMLNVEDYTQDFQISILIQHCDEFDRYKQTTKEEEKWFQIIGKVIPSTTISHQPIQSISSTENIGEKRDNMDIDDDNDLEIIEEDDIVPMQTMSTPTTSTPTTSTPTSQSKKRKDLEKESEPTEVTKKLKPTKDESNDLNK